MFTFLTETLKELSKLLPAAVARVLLVVVFVGAFALHVFSSGRITRAENDIVKMRAEMKGLLDSTEKLADEVKLYRIAIVGGGTENLVNNRKPKVNP